MNIKIYLKLLTSVFMLTSLCYAGTLLDTITTNHTSRKDMFNHDYGANAGEINTCTQNINKIFSAESNVDAKRTATTDEKTKIACAIMATAWTDAISPTTKSHRTAQNPYTLNADGSLKVENKNLYNHYLIIHLLDQLARDVVGHLVSTSAATFEATIDLGGYDSTYDRLYAFDGFDKFTVAGWLNSVHAEHQAGLACVCGDNYYFGQGGVGQSYENAVVYFQIAAKGNSAVGQCSLGVMLQRGHGFPQDLEEAAKYYRLAAVQKYAAL